MKQMNFRTNAYSPAVLLTALCLPQFVLAAGEPDLTLQVKPLPRPTVSFYYSQTIWSDGRHNGFPGIARVGDYYYVAFRNSDSHKAPQSKIVVIRARAADLKKWEQVAEWTRDHDCRDPLVFDNHGKVQVVFHSKEDFYSQSSDGVTWSEPRELDTEIVEPTPVPTDNFVHERG